MKTECRALARVALVLSLFLGSPTLAQIQFNPTFQPDSGFFDPTPTGSGQTLGEVRQETFQAVADYLGEVFFGVVDPATGDFVQGNLSAAQAIDINFLNDEPDGGFLASAAPFFGDDVAPGFSNGAVFDEIISPDAGFDAVVQVNFDSFNFNSGLDDPTVGEFDLFSILLHEIGHALGFLSFADPSGDAIVGAGGAASGNFTLFDSFLVDSNGANIIGPGGVPVGDASNLTGGPQTLFFGGPNATAANGGEPVPIFTPTDFQPGSSISHFDETQPGLGAAVLGPSIPPNSSVREFLPVELAAFEDIGFVVSSPLTLQVDINTGELLLVTPSGAPNTITGLAITSETGVLDPSSFTGLSGNPAFTGFELTSSSSTGIGELNATGSASIGNEPIVLGSGVALPEVAFGEPVDVAAIVGDLGFEFVDEVDGVVTGAIAVVGFNTLVLTIDPDSGEATLSNPTDTTISLQGYAITSANGSLLPEGFEGLAAAGFEVTNVDENGLAELVSLTEDGLTLAQGETVGLGVIFDTGDPLLGIDLEFAFIEIGDQIEGDFNQDGLVNAADFVTFRDGAPIDAALAAFTTNFGATSPPLSGGVSTAEGVVLFEAIPSSTFAAATAVPEPSTAAFAALGVAVGLTPRRRAA